MTDKALTSSLFRRDKRIFWQAGFTHEKLIFGHHCRFALGYIKPLSYSFFIRSRCYIGNNIAQTTNLLFDFRRKHRRNTINNFPGWQRNHFYIFPAVEYAVGFTKSCFSHQKFYLGIGRALLCVQTVAVSHVR